MWLKCCHFLTQFSLATRAAIYRSLRTLRARNRKKKKSLKKGLFGCLQKSLKKDPKKSKNTDFRTFLGIFFDIFRLFRLFFETFLRTPKETLFETFLVISGPEGPETPVNGGSGRNSIFSCERAEMFRTRSTTTRDRNLQFRGAPPPLDFFEFSPVDFALCFKV